MNDYRALSMDEQIALQRENQELRAHVDLLNTVLFESVEDRMLASAIIPAQSLQALREEEKRSIKAEVEEEVIERCVTRVGLAIEMDVDVKEAVYGIPRKYS